jgi:hypothetical protein
LTTLLAPRSVAAFFTLEVHMAKSKRTVLRSSAGKKLYALRDKTGKFKDIQTYARAHAADIARGTTASEAAASAKKKKKKAKAKKTVAKKPVAKKK